eukprot:TRINITY_DN75019_c0_g1_i1.p1 TRINITY_DN75019_c0_g1~~TRINITY_DN75019_c0_g1_i1.p1  ORF type:complete len:583 (-),score=110.03 TRINITY_DN75019_c0_g1_i1:495-2243(-)
MASCRRAAAVSALLAAVWCWPVWCLNSGDDDSDDDDDDDGDMEFVTKQENGSRLLLGNQPFRYVSVNAMSTLLIADPLVNTKPKYDWQWQPYFHARLPTQYEVEDIFLSVKQMGGTVIRVFAFSVEYPNYPIVNSSKTSYWMLVDRANTSKGFKWNPEAGANFDYVIAMAHKYNIRIIPGFINEWSETGGVEAFCAAYGKMCSTQKNAKGRMEFFTDSAITTAFFELVHDLVTKYKDEPAILGWETGNEIGKSFGISTTGQFDTWTVNLAATVKKASEKALVVDGAMTPWAQPRPHVRPGDGIDIIDVHIYPNFKQELDVVSSWFPQFVNISLQAQKALMIGEVICHTGRCLKPLVEAVIAEPAAAGLLVWALTGHQDSTAFQQNNISGHPGGGFFYHHENQPVPACALPWEDYWNYHWPGFDINQVYNESTVMALVQWGAAQMAGNDEVILGTYPSPLPKPPAPIPTLLQSQPYGNWLLYFSGSAGAEWYEVLWATNQTGPFEPTSDGKVLEIKEIYSKFLGAPKQFGFPPVLLQLGSSNSHVCVKMVAKNREKASQPSAAFCATSEDPSAVASSIFPRLV